MIKFYGLVITLLFSLCLRPVIVSAGGAETWTNYGKENVIADIAMQGNYIWCATTNGLVRWDRRDMSYHKYTMIDGLPHSNVSSLAIAPDGAVWCGTVGGVARFDGVSWRVFTQKDGLPDTRVRRIKIAPDGVVWAGTYCYESFVETFGHGIARYDGSTWTTFTFPSNGIRKDMVYDIAISPDSTVWASNSDGVFRFDGPGMTQVYSSVGTNILSADTNNTLWMLSQYTILHKTGETWTTSVGPFGALVEGYGGISMISRNDGSLWIGTEKGALRYDGAAWKLFTTADGLCDNTISTMTEDESGVLWLGTGNGLARFDGTSFQTYRTGEELIGASISSIAFDQYGEAWIGTSGGVSRYNGKNWRSFTSADGLPDNAVQSVTVTSKGEVWAGTAKGAARFIGSGWKTYTTEDSLADNNVTSVVSGKNDTVWFGTDKGLTMFDGTSWKTFKEPGTYIQHLVSTSDGTIWTSNGSSIFRFREGAWTEFPIGGIGGYSVFSLYAAQDSMLYYVEGMCTDVHYQSYSYMLYRLRDTSQYIASPPYGSCFAVGADKTMWYGQRFAFTGLYMTFSGGVNKVQSGKTTLLLDTDGLANLGVNVIAIAPDGAVWFGTGNGLSRYGSAMIIGVGDEAALPEEFAVVSNYPNPFNPSTTISFTLPSAAHAELAVYSVTGQKVRTILSGKLTAGVHSAVWDGKDETGKTMSSGVYLARILSGKQSATGKMLLMK